MKIGSAIKTFLETYDKQAMTMIDDMANQRGRIIRKDVITLFNIHESFDRFNTWLKGYASYCADCRSKGSSPTSSVMTEAFNRMLASDEMFSSTSYTFDKVPSFVRDYIEGVNQTISTIDEVTSIMINNDIDQELIGNIDEYVEAFTDRLNESFTPAMDTLLWASGYNSRKILYGSKPSREHTQQFL